MAEERAMNAKAPALRFAHFSYQRIGVASRALSGVGLSMEGTLGAA
jgi:hypothetical protein